MQLKVIEYLNYFGWQIDQDKKYSIEIFEFYMVNIVNVKLKGNSYT